MCVWKLFSKYCKRIQHSFFDESFKILIMFGILLTYITGSRLTWFYVRDDYIRTNLINSNDIHVCISDINSKVIKVVT